MAIRHVAFVSVLALAMGHTSLAPGAQLSPADLRKLDCAVFGQLNEVDALMVALFEVMKDAARDVRENTALKQQATKATLAAKAGKLAQDNRAIDQGMKESQEKADAQMSAATISLASGVAQGLIQMASTSSIYTKAPSDQESRRLTGTADALKSDIVKLSADLKRSDALANEGKGKGLPAAEVNRMTQQLEKGLQEIRNAKKAAKPC